MPTKPPLAEAPPADKAPAVERALWYGLVACVALTLGVGGGYLLRGQPPTPPLDTVVAERLVEVVEQDAASLRAGVDRLGPADEQARAVLRSRLTGLTKQLAQKKLAIVELRTSPPRDGAARLAAGQHLQAIAAEVETIDAELLALRKDFFRWYEQGLAEARREMALTRKRAREEKRKGESALEQLGAEKLTAEASAARAEDEGRSQAKAAEAATLRAVEAERKAAVRERRLALLLEWAAQPQEGSRKLVRDVRKLCDLFGADRTTFDLLVAPLERDDLDAKRRLEAAYVADALFAFRAQHGGPDASPLRGQTRTDTRKALAETIEINRGRLEKLHSPATWKKITPEVNVLLLSLGRKAPTP